MRVVFGLLSLALCAGVSAQSLTLYDEQLRNGFLDYNYAPHDLANTSPSPVRTGTFSIRFDASSYNGIQFVAPGVHRRITDYQSLRFWVHGGTTGGQQLALIFSIDGFNDDDLFSLTYLDVT